MDKFSHLDRAVKQFGTAKKLATSIKVAPATISQWRDRGSIPVERAIDIEKATKGLVTREQLCPEIFRRVA